MPPSQALLFAEQMTNGMRNYHCEHTMQQVLCHAKNVTRVTVHVICPTDIIKFYTTEMHNTA